MEELTIGQRIAAKRKELGLSQIDMGEKMGVSRQSVSKWEADAAIPEIDKLIALSKLFHVSVGWLLGVEEQEEPRQEPEQTFTPREWEIIDRLTQEKPAIPKWLLPLAAGVTALAVTAAFLSGAAYYHSRTQADQLATISQSVANLTTSLGGGLSDVELLESYGFQAVPSGDLTECAFRFTGIPAYHDPGTTAELVVTLGSKIMVRQECLWTDTGYTAEFTLPAYNGYTAVFCLTDQHGLVHTSRVYDALLYRLMDYRGFGDISVEFSSRGYDGNNLIFDEMRVVIQAPEIFRDTADLWRRCDLVILGDGRELGRLDLLNRSEYSRQINFSGVDVNFYTKNQCIALGDLTAVSRLEVLLCGELTGGLEFQTVVDTLSCAGWQ